MKSIIETITVVVFLGCLAMLAGMQENCSYDARSFNYYPAETYNDTVSAQQPNVKDTVGIAAQSRQYRCNAR